MKIQVLSDSQILEVTSILFLQSIKAEQLCGLSSILKLNFREAVLLCGLQLRANSVISSLFALVLKLHA